MRSQAIINILFLTFTFIFQICSPEYGFRTIIKNNEIEMIYDKIDKVLIVNGVNYNIEENHIQETFNPKLVRWDVSSYICTCMLLISFSINCLKNTFHKLHRFIFKLTIIYFAFSSLSEIICYIYPDLYSKFIAGLNIYVSGTLLIFILISLLTFKTWKK